MQVTYFYIIVLIVLCVFCAKIVAQNNVTDLYSAATTRPNATKINNTRSLSTTASASPAISPAIINRQGCRITNITNTSRAIFSRFNITCNQTNGRFYSGDSILRIPKNSGITLPALSLFLSRLDLNPTSSLNLTLDAPASHSFISIDGCFQPQGKLIVQINFVPTTPTLLTLITWSDNNDTGCSNNSNVVTGVSRRGENSSSSSFEFDSIEILGGTEGCMSSGIESEWGSNSFAVLISPVDGCGTNGDGGTNNGGGGNENVKIVVGVVVGVVGGLLVIVLVAIVIGMVVWWARNRNRTDSRRVINI
eukprot:TRINITY_DN1102_c0_g1_i1.p1 TRINITY_DN1102_c0_g1~~TRINITY_DN1102_c0_g1_i1.p1  ORF type:complete len:307 (-),score=48.90 TRINITY_DN1102_c0_g1_i1:40-960(-)